MFAAFTESNFGKVYIIECSLLLYSLSVVYFGNIIFKVIRVARKNIKPDDF